MASVRTVLLNLLPVCILSPPSRILSKLALSTSFLPSLTSFRQNLHWISNNLPPTPRTDHYVRISLCQWADIHTPLFLAARSQAFLRSSVPAAGLLDPNPYPLLHVPNNPLGSGSRWSSGCQDGHILFLLPLLFRLPNPQVFLTFSQASHSTEKTLVKIKRSSCFMARGFS